MHAEPLVIPDEEEQAVTPGDDSNDDPTPPLPVDPPGTPSRNPAVDSAPTASADPAEPLKDRQAMHETREEPEIGNESDIPSDGRDPEGEGMIREVPRTTGSSPRPERS